MADQQKKAPRDAVGLILAYRSESRLVVIGRVRGELNEQGKPQKWKGATQTTAAGKNEDGETSIETLWREVAEEIGHEIVPVLKDLYAKGKFIELVNREDPKDHMNITVWGVVLPHRETVEMVIKGMCQSPGDKCRFIHRYEVDEIVDLQTHYTAEVGVTDGKIAMFPLPREAVSLAFQKLG